MMEWLALQPVGVLVVALVASCGSLAAQEPSPAHPSCDGRIVSAITITPSDPSFLAFPRRLRALARGVGLVHTTSKPEVISRFLLVENGEPCTERKRAESERILRLQPFLADATVRAIPDVSGGTHIEVETIDEIPTVFGMQFRGVRPAALRFGNGNVGGQGLYLAADVEHGLAYRTGLGVYGVAYQVFGRPYTLALAAERATLGGSVILSLGHPFLTDLQRTAWHVGFDAANGYMSFVRPDAEALSLSVRRRFWDIGGVRRIGIGRRIAFIGVLLTHESVVPANRFLVVSDSGVVADTATLSATVAAYRNLRLNAVVGLRALSFMTVRGFDALTAVQDVATGLQVGGLIGQSIPTSEWDDDAFVAADLYAGLGSAASFGAMRLKGEARNDRRADRWDSMVGSGRIAWYVKPAAAHVFIGSVEAAGGWRQRVPFQLALGDRQGGVRGYQASRSAGAVRSVARLEERWSFAELTKRGAFGVAGFAEAGRVYAGEAPFGVNGRTKVGLGIGFLAAIPTQSQRLWRLDLAVPVSADPHARPEVRFASVWTRSFWREPGDVTRGRAGVASSPIFTWP